MKCLNEYIESYENFSLMLCDENDIYYVNEIAANKIKPLGYIDDFNYNNVKFEEHRKTLLNCIANITKLEENDDSNGDVRFKYSYKDDKLYKTKLITKGKNGGLLKAFKTISNEKVADNKEKIYEILFGFAHRNEDLSTLEKLVDFICSKEYENSNKETIRYVFDQFLTSCYEQKLKTYGLKKYIENKLNAII